MATAGLSETGLGRAGAGFAVDVVTGKKIDEAALSAARVAVAGTLQSSLAKYIGAGGFDFATREVMHAGLGAATGAILSEDAEEGAVSGAIASVVATTVANFIKEDPNVIGERAVAKARAEGSPLDKASLQPYIQAELRSTIDISRLSAAVVTLFAGYDVSVGIDVATTAVINNCAATMERQVFESSALKEALQEAVDAVPGMLDKAAGVIEDNPEAVEAGAQIFMAAGGVMAEDRGTKAPKIKTKGQAKADKILAKGYSSAAKSMAKGLRTAADKMRGNRGAVAAAEKRTHRPLLPGEGRVGTYGELYKHRKPGDNLTPNHIPQAAYMKNYGVRNQDGIAMWMEHPYPGTGGRHRQTRTYGVRPNSHTAPRDELARDIADLRKIYKKDGVYTPEIRQSLQDVIKRNKSVTPDLFAKK